MKSEFLQMFESLENHAFEEAEDQVETRGREFEEAYRETLRLTYRGAILALNLNRPENI
jgi:hypothetical protein